MIDQSKRLQLQRQVAHWTTAIERMGGLESWASVEAWNGLERYLGVALRKNFADAIERLKQQSGRLKTTMNFAETSEQLEQVRQKLLNLRLEFVRGETMLDFFGDAINTRTSANMAGLLNACDVLAGRSMRQILDPFGKKTPPVLTYVDNGLGASILKAGLRLWDGTTINPVSAIKIVRHNLLRPTSLIHEAGHQVAHQLEWNDELASALSAGLRSASLELADLWSSWASEISADAFAFAHTGYGSVAALHDVLAGEEELVFQLRPGDPHPMSFIRVLLGTEMCKQSYGPGSWDDLAASWALTHPLERAPSDSRTVVVQSVPLLPRIVEICLRFPMRAFGGATLASYIDPERVSPKSLAQLEAQAGAALFTSSHWTRKECLRITALTGLRCAINPSESAQIWKQQENFMLLLGSASQPALAA